MEFIENGRVTAADITILRESVGWNPMTLEYKKALENSSLYISCYENCRLVGFINVVSNLSTDAYIQDVMVLPEYQNQRIGSQLINMTIAKLKTMGIQNVSVIFEKSLSCFYSKFGFKMQESGRLKL